MRKRRMTKVPLKRQRQQQPHRDKEKRQLQLRKSIDLAITSFGRRWEKGISLESIGPTLEIKVLIFFFFHKTVTSEIMFPPASQRLR